MFPGISEPSRLTETKDRALNVTPEILTQQFKDPRIFSFTTSKSWCIS